MKIHPLSNGQAYGWSKIRSLFDFFFPYAKNGKFEFIRAESSATSTGQHDFYTFRAFYMHYLCSFYTSLDQAIREWVNFVIFPFATPFPKLNVGLAIALDTSTTGAASSSPISWSHTCTGSNMILFVAAGNHSSGSPTIATPTYNSVSMTLVGSQRTLSNNKMALYLLTGPTTGANTVSYTIGGTIPTGNGASISYSGASQTGQPDAANGTTGSSNNPSTTVTTVASNCWVVGACFDSTATSPTANLTERQTFTYTTAGSAQADLQDTNGAVGAGTAQAVGWTLSTIFAWGIQGASFSPAAAGAATINFLGLMGVGS